MRNSRPLKIFRELSEGERQQSDKVELAFEWQAELTVGFDGRRPILRQDISFLAVSH